MKKIKSGVLRTNNVRLQPHELATVEFLLRLGYNIELIIPSYTPNNKNPDFFMEGVLWESKSPMGKRVDVVERAFKKALSQSANVVIDLRRTSIPTVRSITVLKRVFDTSCRVKKLLIITREKELVDMCKRT